MALDTRFELKVLANPTSPLDLATIGAPLNISKVIALLSGVGSGQADKIFADTRTVAASTTDSLDVATGGGLTDLLGVALALVKVKAIYIAAAAANTNNVVWTRPAANGVPLFSAAGDALPILPGGVELWIAPGAGVTVTAATADLIDMVNSGAGTSVTYDIVIVGTSA